MIYLFLVILIVSGFLSLHFFKECAHKNTTILGVELKNTIDGVKSVTTRKCYNCGREFSDG